MRTSSIRALQSDTGLDRTAFQTVCVQRRQLGCRRDTARSLLQSAVPRRSCCRAPALVASIDISHPHAAQQQTRRMPLLRFNDGTDGRTDGRTDSRPLQRPRCTQCVGLLAVSCIVRPTSTTEQNFVEIGYRHIPVKDDTVAEN